MSAKYSVNASDAVELSQPEEPTRSKGVHLKSSHVLAALVVTLVMVIGVALIVYFASARSCPDDSTFTEPGDAKQKWDDCVATASQKGLCLRGCATTPLTKPMTTPTLKPTQPISTSAPKLPMSTSAPKLPMSTSAPKLTNIRLPTDLYPEHYDILIYPRIYGDDPKLFDFSGEIAIRLRCDRSTDTIVLHSKSLTYDNSSISVKRADDDMNIGFQSYSIDAKRDFIKFHVKQRLEVGVVYVLSANFSGPLTKDLTGLYLSSYARGNKMIYLATTQLQPTSARLVFPCFDEPAIKSRFRLKLVRQAHMRSLSNMEIVDTQKLKDNLEVDVYNVSLKMSVYLLAFVISDFTNVTKTVNNIKVSVWTRPEFFGQGDFALEMATTIVSYFGQFFQIPYPMRKLDMLAIPDFAPGAMENWGLIIYRESRLLYDEKNTAAVAKTRIASIVSHELAHMWFGNLVTLTWWEDLWLNEGFASFVEYLGVDYARPLWNTFESFRNEDTESAMALDGFKSSHPLFVPVTHPDEINNIFDKISYAKGAHIIKMMKFFMGDTKFRDGLKEYLTVNAYSDTNHTDLWRSLGHSSGIDVNGIMSTWVLQMNFPVVHISRKKITSKTGRSNGLKMSQERFLVSKDEPEQQKYTSPYGYRWRIPVSVISNSASFTDTSILWLNETNPSQSFSLSNELEDDKWILGNHDNNVFCRVNYDTENWNLLAKQLNTNHTAIPGVDRVTLIHDACKLSRAKYLPTDVCLDILSYVHNEADYAALTAAFQNINFISRMLRGSDVNSAYKAWVKSKVDVIYNNMPNLDDSLSITQLLKLSLITTQACHNGNKKCLDMMSGLFGKLMNESNSQFDPNLIVQTYCFGIKQGTTEDWMKLYTRLERVTAMERNAIIASLGCTNSKSLLRLYLNLALDEMRSQDLRTAVSSVASNSLGQHMAFQFFVDNWDAFMDRLGTSVFSITAIIKAVTKRMTTKEELGQLRALIAAHPNSGPGKLALQSALSYVQANVEWVSNNEQAVSVWLKRH